MLSNRTRPPGPSLALDLYSREALLNPHETYRRIREAGAAVWLQKQRMWAIGRVRDVREARKVSSSHSSVLLSSGTGLDTLICDIPELLLKANQSRGQGIFSNVTCVQRLRTTGGVAPAGSCTDGSQQATR